MFNWCYFRNFGGWGGWIYIMLIALNFINKYPIKLVSNNILASIWAVVIFYVHSLVLLLRVACLVSLSAILFLLWSRCWTTFFKPHLSLISSVFKYWHFLFIWHASSLKSVVICLCVCLACELVEYWDILLKTNRLDVVNDFSVNISEPLLLFPFIDMTRNVNQVGLKKVVTNILSEILAILKINLMHKIGWDLVAMTGFLDLFYLLEKGFCKDWEV